MRFLLNESNAGETKGRRERAAMPKAPVTMPTTCAVAPRSYARSGIRVFIIICPIDWKKLMTIKMTNDMLQMLWLLSGALLPVA